MVSLSCSLKHLFWTPVWHLRRFFHLRRSIMQKKQLCSRQRNVFRRCVNFVFSLSPDRSFRNRRVWKAHSVPRGRCSGSAAQWGISSRSVKSWGSSVVGCQPALQDDTERRAHTCCRDSPWRRSSKRDSCRVKNPWVLSVYNLNNVASAVTSPDSRTGWELGIERSCVSLKRGLMTFFQLSQSWSQVTLLPSFNLQGFSK